ncbi:MAG: thioesterase family protein [Actinomycetia bacterium]|nr:thioesterase family protein [Actinomycetes bacterium]MCP5032684.1 thioesterase family protein [Actinomycetes bacterium]
MTSSYFVTGPDGLTPEATAVGPWSPDMLHGRFLGGLAARALEADVGDPGWRAARMNVDLFRPAAMAPVQVETTVLRSGRRIRVADALLVCAGHEVGRATIVMLRASEDPPGKIWRPTTDPWPEPETLPPNPEGDGPSSETWLIHTVEGGFGSGSRSRLWTNDSGCLVDDEPLSPFVRAAISADLACPLANSSDQGLFYINADYTLALGRYPIGPWIGIEVTQQIAGDGISMATSILVDRDGPFATSTGVSLATPPLVRES